MIPNVWFCEYCGGGNEITRMSCAGCGNRITENAVVTHVSEDEKDDRTPESPYYMDGGSSVRHSPYAMDWAKSEKIEERKQGVFIRPPRSFNSVWGSDN